MNDNNIFRKILNEGFYKGEDLNKHKFKYLKKVLDNFKTEDFIYTRNEDGDLVELYIQDLMNDKEKEFQDNITRFKNWLNNSTSKLSDEVGTVNDFLGKLESSKTGRELTKAREQVLQDFTKSFGISFTKIEKKDPEIISTPEQEGIQAIFLAAKILGNDCFNNIEVLYKNENKLKPEEIKAREDIEKLFYKNDLGITLANKRLVFSKEENKKVLKKLANVLKTDLPTEFSKLKDRRFTIIHPDGLVNKYESKNENTDFAKILFGKDVQFIPDEGQKRSLSKDTFIPADIYIIPLDTISILRNIVENAGRVFSPKSIVSLSNELFNYKIGKDIVPLIYPISLKMKAGIPEFHRLDNSTEETENLIQVGIDNITNIHFNQTGNSTMEIEHGNDTLVLEFRTKEVGKRWQCNAKNKSNRDAIEGGSAKTYMKMVFDDEMDGYINDDDVNKIVDKFGNKIEINQDLNLNEHSVKNESTILEESFRKFFEDENKSTSNITAKDMVLLAKPDTIAHKNITSLSAKEGNIGLGLFCKKLIDHGIEGSGNYNEKLSQIVQMSFKMNNFVQDTYKLM